MTSRPARGPMASASMERRGSRSSTTLLRPSTKPPRSTWCGSNTTPDINAVLDEPPVECVNEFESLTDPVITGIPKVGQPLTVSNGTWDPVPTSYSYAWFSNGAQIPGATAATYIPAPSDAGEYLYAVVTAKKDDFDDVNASSANFGPIADAVVNAALPKITGKAVVGSTLTATPGVWVPSTAPVTYQWLASGVAIPGATGKTFKPATAQLGKKLSVRVTATKVGAESGVATSAVTTIVMVQPTMSLARKVKKTKVILTIQVKAVGVVAVVGKVKVFRKSKLLKTVSLKAGKVVVKLKKQPKGKAKYTATYVGLSPVLPVSKSIKVAV